MADMPKPIFLVVSDEPQMRETLGADLERRFGNDYRIVRAAAESARSSLTEIADRSEQVAILFADQAIRNPTAVALFAQARHRHPFVRRVLVIPRGEWSATAPAIAAMALGQMDYHIYGPWEPPGRRTGAPVPDLERFFYPAVAEFLSAWSRSQPDPVPVFRIVGDRWSARSYELRNMFSQVTLPYTFDDVNSDAGRQLLRELGVSADRLPVVAYLEGAVFRDPSNAELAETLGFNTTPLVDRCDVAILGAGPAGLAAAVSAASEGLHTVLLEPMLPGGQASTSSLIRNYLGFNRGVSGANLTNRAIEQAWLFGTDFVISQACVAISVQGNDRIVTTTDKSQVAARVVLLATGASWRRLGIPGLEALLGAGVFYGAGGSEARAMQGRHVFVVGGGNSAGQAALHLARYAASVTILVRRSGLAATMSEYLIREIGTAENIAVQVETEVAHGGGTGYLEWIALRSRTSGRTARVPADALFLLIGAEPRTEWLDGAVQRDERGFVLTGADMHSSDDPGMDWPLARPPLLLETSMPGVFAAGDVRHGSVKRVASAVGEGAIAIQLVHEYLTKVVDSAAGRAFG